jgi:hypothetical protein
MSKTLVSPCVNHQFSLLCTPSYKFIIINHDTPQNLVDRKSTIAKIRGNSSRELDSNLTNEKQRGINHSQRFAPQKFIANGVVLLLTRDMVEDCEGRTLSLHALEPSCLM